MRGLLSETVNHKFSAEGIALWVPTLSLRCAATRPHEKYYYLKGGRLTRDAGRSNRGSPPAQLPRVKIVVDIDDKTCPCCQGELHRIAISA
jgi:hypothetical protein